MIFRCLESSCLWSFPSSVFDCFCCIECTNCVSTSNSSLDSSGGTTCSLVSETSPLLDTLDTTWRTGSTRREEQMRRHHNFWNAHMLFHSLIHLTLRVCVYSNGILAVFFHSSCSLREEQERTPNLSRRTTTLSFTRCPSRTYTVLVT